ncbi:MAG: hypothetical protein ABI824_16180 [Acidobacteriota bacterium]
MKSARPVLAQLLAALLLVTVLLPANGMRQRKPTGVSAGPNGAAQVLFDDGSRLIVPKERDQVSIRDAQVARDGTAGWLAEYSISGVADAIAGTLVIWREGKSLRKFQADQSFWSWTFYAQGKQVAYHVGPLHGERKSHCELYDVASGRRLAVWDGDLDSAVARPAWAQGLTH